jgi:hypothetical protein
MVNRSRASVPVLGLDVSAGCFTAVRGRTRPRADEDRRRLQAPGGCRLGWSTLRAEIHEVGSPAAKLLLWQSNARTELTALEGTENREP